MAATGRDGRSFVRRSFIFLISSSACTLLGDAALTGVAPVGVWTNPGAPTVATLPATSTPVPGVIKTSASWTNAAYAKYDENEARLFMEYARVAFCTQQHILKWDCGPMCQAATTVPGSVRFLGRGSDWDEQGFVALIPSMHTTTPPAGQAQADGPQCVISFRGSVDIMNWVNDGEFWETDWPDWPEASGASWCSNCGVHHGFASAYRELRPAMLAAIRELGCRRVAVTGHSAGAALATLASFEVRASLGLLVDPVWTFGKPRVGDANFVKAYIAAATAQGADPPMWRVVHYHDPVPRLPPNGPLTWVTDYVHEPLEVYYPSRESSWTRVCPSSLDHPESHGEGCAWRTDVVECLGDPAFDHTTYLNMSTLCDKFSKFCTDDTAVPTPPFLSPLAVQTPARQLLVV